MSIAVNKIASRLKKDLGYYSIEFDLKTDCEGFIESFDKRIKPIDIILTEKKYVISGSKSESNRYAVIYYRHIDAYPHLLLRIPTSEPLSDQIQLNSLVFKLSDVYTLEKLYNMTNNGVKDYAQRVRKAVKRAFRMKSSPVEQKLITTGAASGMRKYLKIPRTPNKKSPERIMRTVDLDVAITPKKRNASLPVRVPLKPAERRQVKSASRYHSLRAPPRIDAPPEAPLAEAQPKVPIAEVPLADVPPAEAPLERKTSRSNRAAPKSKSRSIPAATIPTVGSNSKGKPVQIDIDQKNFEPILEEVKSTREKIGEHLNLRYKSKNTNTMQNIYDRNVTPDYVLCVAAAAYVMGMKNNKQFNIQAILKVWYYYVECAKKVLLNAHAEMPSMRLLKLWTALKKLTTVRVLRQGEQKWCIYNGINMRIGFQNFLYELIVNNGSCNCACGTSMLYMLIKTLDPSIDLRTVMGQMHTLLAVNDGNSIMLLETTLAIPRVMSVHEYQIKMKRCVFINPKQYPCGMTEMHYWLYPTLRNGDSLKEFYEIIKPFKLEESKDLQVKLYVNTCKLMSNSGIECDTAANSLLEIYKEIYNDWKPSRATCLYNVNLRAMQTMFILMVAFIKNRTEKTEFINIFNEQLNAMKNKFKVELKRHAQRHTTKPISEIDVPILCWDLCNMNKHII